MSSRPVARRRSRRRTLNVVTTTAVVLYTSGTVGGPKGVMLSHDALTHSMHAMIDVLGIGPGDVYGLAVPMSHISGPMLLGTAMRSGMTLLLFDRFVPSRFLDEAERHGMTIAAHGAADGARPAAHARRASAARRSGTCSPSA